MTAEGVFSGRLLAIWISASVALLAASLYFMLMPEGTGPGADSVGPTAFSRSALGHAGIAEILQRLGVRVVKSRYDSLGKVGEEDLLVIAEPPVGNESLASLEKFLRADRLLLILPKRDGVPSREHPGWISDAQLLPAPEIQLLLTALDIDATVSYTRKAVVWKNEFGADPEISAPVQLLESDNMQPLVSTDRGALVAHFDRGRGGIWILSDPDVMENHGLSQSANAAFAVALIDRLRGFNGRVVFDETIHGYVSRPPSPLRLLFTFPYVLATAQGVLAIGLLLWATVGRFGKAEPVAPALESGKLGLIRNIAELLGFARHHEIVVQRYVQEALRDAARLLHAPPLPEGQLVPWLARVGKLRGAEPDCAQIVRRMEQTGPKGTREASTLMAVARDIYRWRRGIIDGHPGDTLARGKHPRRGP
jgi:hypothetical protein